MKLLVTEDGVIHMTMDNSNNRYLLTCCCHYGNWVSSDQILLGDKDRVTCKACIRNVKHAKKMNDQSRKRGNK